MSEIVISISNVSKKYELGSSKKGSIRNTFDNLFLKRTKSEFYALKNISFNVKKGEVIGIIGNNGAGKSTLLKVLSKITKPTSGKIEYFGRIASLLEVGTGFHPELTGRENIFLNGTILGMNKSEIREKMSEIISFSGIAKFLDTPVKHYSSGMYVRLAFSVAAHLNPEILIIDEVLAVGDKEFQDKCLGKMKSISSTGRTVLFVSHNMKAVADLCNRCVLIEKGKIKYISTTNDVISEYLGKRKRKQKVFEFNNNFQRSGNGKIQLKKIYLTNHNNEITREIKFEDSFTFNLEISKENDFDHFKSLTISIGLFNNDGYRLSFISDKFNAIEFHNEKQIKLKCLMKKVPFNSGIYYYNITIKTDNELQDWIINAGNFELTKQNNLDNQKLEQNEQSPIVLKYDWQ